MRLVILFILASVFAASCSQKHAADNASVNVVDSTFTISGKVAGLDTGNIIFVHRAGDDKVYDTVNIKKGQFELTGKVPANEGMAAYTCFIQGKDDATLSVMVENSKISVNAKSDSLENAVISGSKVQEDYNAFNQLTHDVDSAMSALGEAYAATKDRGVLDIIDKEYDHLDSIRRSYVADFVKAHSRSVMSAYIISRTLLIQPKAEVVEPVYNSLDSSVKQTKLGKVIAEVIEAAKKTAVGQIAPDFMMNDRDGKPVALSSFRGKVIFLDFWSSWCGPCRKENPNIVAAYAKFHSPKFDILGVSLDKNKDKWEEAIAKDKLTWNHVSDLKGWGNAAGKLYGIRAIPANLLLDKNGKILARNLYGSDLDKKLAEVLK